MSEAQIQNKIIKYLNGIGAYTVKTISTNRSGTPDVICCLEGKFIALEVKTQKGRVSELQKHHIEQINNSGGLAAVVRSVEEVKEIISLLLDK